MARIAQSVQRVATSWMVRGPNPGGVEIFRTRPNRSWSPPNLLYKGYRICFPGVKRSRRGVYHPPVASNAEVKERVELYRYSSSGSSWPLQETLTFQVTNVTHNCSFACCLYRSWSFLTLRDVREQGGGKVFGSGRMKVAGGWKRLHNEELYECTTIRVIISMTMRMVGQVARVGEEKRAEFC